MTERITVSLPDEDLPVLDAYVQAKGLSGGRSAGVHAAIRMLTTAGLEQDYAGAFTANPDEAELWDATAGDGLR